VRTRLAFPLRLVINSPFLFPAADQARFGLDAVALRDAWGRPLIPGDQLRGVVREALEDLSAAAPAVAPAALLADLFGAAPADARSNADDPGAEAFAPQRGHMLFGDLVAEQGNTPPARAVRIRIEAETGAAADGALQMVELVAPPGAGVAFAGELVVLARAGQEAAIERALRHALPLVCAIGAQKSIGFGSVAEFHLDRPQERRFLLPVSGSPPQEATSVVWEMRLDRPFLVNARREADNLFVGEDVIPGGVIKGALARRLELAGELGRFGQMLSDMRITHAVPEMPDGAPAGDALPLSLVAVKPRNHPLLVGDSLGTPPGLGVNLEDATGEVALPGWYAPDWKDEWDSEVRRRVGWAAPSDPATDIRVHTAIDRGSGAAAEGLLYSTVALAHRNADAATNSPRGPERTWRLSLHPPPEADRGLWQTLLAVLQEGLDGIGRTGASARFVEHGRVKEAFDASDILPFQPGGTQFAVVLRTPAALIEPASGLDAFSAYTGYWQGLLCKARLIDMVVRHRLAGSYQARRHRPYGSGYVPFVLTEPGSVFLLDGVGTADLTALMASGLPVPALNGREVDWRTCPFVPQNGYGSFRCWQHPAGLDRVRHV
jgi:hypothetical protein